MRCFRKRMRNPGSLHPFAALGVIVLAGTAMVANGAAMATSVRAPANGEIAFVDGGPSLSVVNPQSSAMHLLATCSAGSSCGTFELAWSPMGRRLAFVRGVFAVTQPSRMSLYVVGANGGAAKRLVSCGSCGSLYSSRPAWSPNGRWIVFSRDSSRPGGEGLSIVAAAGGKPRRLTDCTSCADIDPTWSPNGHLLLFSREGRASEQLYSIRPDGPGLARIATGGDPQWSPDGRRIAFEPTPDSIAVANADGSQVHVLLQGTAGSGPGKPSWSPDGKKLLFFDTPGYSSNFKAEVWTMNTDGSGKKRLYHSGCCVGTWAPPVWSPDGRMIAFSADSAGGTFVENADGSGLRKLSPTDSRSLSWQPRP
jgi:Tol biopolymer transport system component